MSRRKGSGDDDRDESADLWQMVTRSVRPLSRKKAAPAKDVPRKPAGVKMRADPPPVPSLSLRAPAPAKGFDKATETRLKKGKLPVESRLDLHGMTQDEAHAALHRFIRASYARGLRTVLVITGKGRVGGGTLRRMVPLWLQDGELRGVVLAAVPARAKDGGEGALYLRLRNPEKK